MSKGILTIATGKRQFIHMAKMLAISLKLNYPVLQRAIVTDSEDPELTELYDIIIPADMGKGNGYIQKLNMYDYSPFDETIFIDADSMVVQPFDFLWDAFKSCDVSVIGFKKDSGVHFGASIESICNNFKIEDILIFNGGLYYFKKNNTSKSVFERAKGLIGEYDQLGFAKVRGTSINEEPLLSVAMSIYKMEPIHDGWKGMYMASGNIGGITIDVLTGKCKFKKNGVLVNPAIMHYGGTSYEKFYYQREAIKLKLVYIYKLPKKITSILVNALFNPSYMLYVFSYRLARRVMKGSPFKFKPVMPYNKYD